MSYEQYKEKARAKITQYGSPITLVKTSDEGVYNPDTNKYEGIEELFEGVALQSEYDSKFVDGTNIKKGDKKYMAVLDVQPVVNDKLIYCGKEYTVVDVKELNYNGSECVYYTIQAR